MKYVDEFRQRELAAGLAAAIAKEADTGRDYRLMEFCGGHTHAIFRYGIQDLVPGNVEMVHGPGCPVCVLPMGRLDMAIRLAADNPEVILASYGDWFWWIVAGIMFVLELLVPAFFFLWFGFALIFLITTLRVVALSASNFQILLGTDDIMQWWFYAAVPLSWLLLSARITENFMDDLRAFRSGGEIRVGASLQTKE